MDLQEVGVWTGSSWLRIEDRWQALGHALMNLQVHKMRGIS